LTVTKKRRDEVLRNGQGNSTLERGEARSINQSQTTPVDRENLKEKGIVEPKRGEVKIHL